MNNIVSASISANERKSKEYVNILCFFNFILLLNLLLIKLFLVHQLTKPTTIIPNISFDFYQTARFR